MVKLASPMPDVRSMGGSGESSGGPGLLDAHTVAGGQVVICAIRCCELGDRGRVFVPRSMSPSGPLTSWLAGGPVGMGGRRRSA
jgi:hypothetical protein